MSGITIGDIKFYDSAKEVKSKHALALTIQGINLDEMVQGHKSKIARHKPMNISYWTTLWNPGSDLNGARYLTGVLLQFGDIDIQYNPTTQRLNFGADIQNVDLRVILSSENLSKEILETTAETSASRDKYMTDIFGTNHPKM